MSLSTDASNQQQHHHGGPGAMGNHHLGGPGVVFRQAAANQHTLTNHFFHFDGKFTSAAALRCLGKSDLDL